MKKIELLAPAGNLEKLKYALHYGADAVYVGVPDFSLRTRINNFDRQSLQEAADYVRKNKKKLYVTINIYAHNRHLVKITEHLKFLRKLNADAVVISDPGVLRLANKYLPGVDVHLSTQANATNWQAVKFWQEQGIKRVIMAREVSLKEIKEIKKRVPQMELEYFVHGAMCMSYSGRCILSKWMTGRSANLGDCTQPCRWRYQKTGRVYETSVVDEREKIAIDLEEDRHGTYFFNSYDMNMLEHIDKLVAAGVDSFKIEGRAKSVYYLATVVKAYRKAIDSITDKNKFKKAVKEGKRELNNLVHRGYWTGFLFGDAPPHNIHTDNFKSDHKFVGEIEGAKGKLNVVRVHNEIFLKDELEAIDPEKIQPLKIKKIHNHKMEEAGEAHGGHDKRYFFEFDKVLEEKNLLRKKL